MGQAQQGQVMTAILTGGSAVGSYVNATRQAGAVVATSDFDTKLAAMQAQDAILRGNVAARAREVAGTGEVGSARARMAAQGIDVSSGSAVDVQGQDAYFSELDAQTIRNNAAREAMGYTTQAALNKLGARAKAQSIEDQGIETLATGAARTYGIFAKNKIPGGKTTFAGAGDSSGSGDYARSGADSP